MSNRNFGHLVSAYKEQLEIGDVQVVYEEVVKYMQRLKTQLSKAPDTKYSFGNVFQGYMDYTYFYLSNDYLKGMKLKLALVINHKNMGFEVWLLGQTKELQRKYWHQLKATSWVQSNKIPKYSIFEVSLIDSPNFDDLNTLSLQIESELGSVSNEIITSLRNL